MKLLSENSTSANPARSTVHKLCVGCGREMDWRKAWSDNWEAVKYCSKKCRRERADRREAHLEQAIIDLLTARQTNATICPSEVARRREPERWRPLMEPVRRAARRLAHRAEIDILQNGKVVDAANFRGPIRLRLRP